MPGWRNWQTQRTQNAEYVVCNSRSSNSFRGLASEGERILRLPAHVVLGLWARFGHKPLVHLSPLPHLRRQQLHKDPPDHQWLVLSRAPRQYVGPLESVRAQDRHVPAVAFP
jgi:hypothetical protein